MENEIVYDDISDFCNCSKTSKFCFSSEIPNREHFLGYSFFGGKITFQVFLSFQHCFHKKRLLLQWNRKHL
jgi:hypothetical protein